MLISAKQMFYTTESLNKVSLKRKDSSWIKDLQSAPHTRYTLLHGYRPLFAQDDSGTNQAIFLQYHEIEPFFSEEHLIFLGEVEGNYLFSLNISHHDENDILTHIPHDGFFEDLRRAGPLPNKEHAAQLGYGKAMAYWHDRHEFCGNCGHPTRAGQAGHVRNCQNPACGLEHYPRTDPAVIMLVHKNINGVEKCLLSHSGRMKEGMYSTLAGFVEPGETLEQAVSREVLEETGVHTHNVKYAGSQPWPFPASMMIGFYAEALSENISLDDDELEDAQWFSREDLLNFPKTGRFLSSHDSISRQLIDGWLFADQK